MQKKKMNMCLKFLSKAQLVDFLKDFKDNY